MPSGNKPILEPMLIDSYRNFLNNKAVSVQTVNWCLFSRKRESPPDGASHDYAISAITKCLFNMGYVTRSAVWHAQLQLPLKHDDPHDMEKPFHITGPLSWESTGDWWFLLTKGLIMRSFGISFVVNLNKHFVGGFRHHCLVFFSLCVYH